MPNPVRFLEFSKIAESLYYLIGGGYIAFDLHI